MKKARDIHGLLDRVDLTVNTNADREVLEKVLRASRESTSPVSQGDVRRILVEAGLWWRSAFWRIAGSVAVALLIVSSWIAIDSRRKVNDLKAELEQTRRDIAIAQQDVATAPTDDSATINFYLEEHRDVVARHASFGPDASQAAQIRVNQHDVLYYEVFDDEPEYMHPGIIIRGRSARRQTDSPEAPVISNGHTLNLSEARQAAGFDLVSPLWFHPGYSLDQIRRIEDRDAMQLLYTDGIDSVSLFEQPLDGQQGLEAKDFREYAVYQNTGQTGRAILAWRDDELSYVLIGNTEMSQLMNMAQSISAGK